LPSYDEEGGPLAVEGEKFKISPSVFLLGKNPAPSSEGALV